MSRPFDTGLFTKQLPTNWLGKRFQYLAEVDSTNTFLKKIPEEELYHGMIALTDDQTKGRGQHSKKWEANAYENLTFSIAFKPNSPERLTLLTLSCAFAIAEVLGDITEKKTSLKWPNDIYVGEKKIGGILTECTFMGPRPERVLIGIGLNINQSDFGDEIKNSATSLFQITGNQHSREEVLSKILLQIEKTYELWESRAPELHKKISQNLIGFGVWVRLQINKELMDSRYKFLGVNEKGELLVLNEKLELKSYSHEQIRIITGNESISKIS
jgi:BirA family transcriptional regulator, biotin operon repressor / biotin---[acetyl-CoA-carboxylase] ligase